ncbi:MAG: phosphatidate cytidylyltransferase, partial [archaeon]|nr:phosphatidate cytidylyltransferase [archaeon]
MGHFYCILMIFGIIFGVFYELLNLPRYTEKNKKIKNISSISWGFFFCGVYFIYILMIRDNLEHFKKYFLMRIILDYHYVISFTLYALNFYRFFLNLQKGVMRYQIAKLGWAHAAFLFFTCNSALIESNIVHGMVWFLLPVTFIIINDMFAYICGRLFGKHQLTVISPKKTWEGYLGAVFFTIIWWFISTRFCLNYEFLLCPEKDLSLVPFSMYYMKCDTSFYKEILYNLNLGITKWEITRLHIHTLPICLFASTYGPLGGLFASAFKRSIGIKDFSNLIPGHGGMTDRMDCQFLMGC